jgi:hypothetical protein
MLQLSKISEDCEIPVEYHDVFEAYCVDFLLEHEGCLNEFGIFWEEDNLHGIISKWHSFFRPIADMVESDLNDQVCLDVYVEPSYISMTTIIITADVKSGQETLAFKYQLKAQNVIEQETFLEMLEAYYNSLYMSIKELTDGNKIRVVIVEPGNEPKEKGISNTLEELQNIVGGYIEAIPLHNEIGSDLNIVCNEEGKLLGLPLNRALDSDILCGTFIVVKSDEDNFVSLTDDEVKNVKDRFALSGYSFK